MLTQRFDAALLLASSLHRDQFRKQSSVPYFAHLMAVAALVLEEGGCEDEAIAALLHDVVEDQSDSFPGGRLELRRHIRKQFGSTVAEIVDACTDDDGYQKGTAPSPAEERERWLQRKGQYLKHLATIPEAALRVSCADKLHNAQSILVDHARHGRAVWERFRTGSRDDQVWYYSALDAAFQSRIPGSSLSRRLGEAVRRMRELPD